MMNPSPPGWGTWVTRTEIPVTKTQIDAFVLPQVAEFGAWRYQLATSP